MEKYLRRCNFDTLYKYVKAKHVRSIMENGIFRISTLYEFRNIEQYNSEIGDNKEGIKTIYSSDNPEDWEDDKSAEFLRKYHMINGPHPNVRNNLIYNQENSLDMFMYSVTEEYNAEAMISMGYEVAIKINNKDDIFFKILSHAMHYHHDLNPWNIIERCKYDYKTKHVKLEDGVPAAFLKDPKYSYQKEVRMAWFPKKTTN